MVNKQFYIEFGKVVYAMAMADGAIQEEEKEILFRMVREELAPIGQAQDEFGTDLAFYVLFSFESEDEIGDTVEDAMDSFLFFLKDHNVKIGEKVKRACMNILKNMAKSYGRITKSEQRLIDQISGRFE